MFKLLHQSSSDTIILPEVYQMEGFSNWMKIVRMVSNYFCSKLEQLKMVPKKSGTWTYTHTYTHTHAHTHTRTRAHIHIHMCILTSWTKAMVRKIRCPLAKSAWFEDASIHKRVNKTINKSFKRSAIRYTKADNTLYSTNSHFLKKEVKSKQKHPRCKKRSGQELKGPC